MDKVERRHVNVVNIDEVEPSTNSKGKFGCSYRRLGDAAGGSEIGCTWYEVPPERTAFPFHYHCLEEESIYVLEGEGTLRLGDQRVAVRAGDYVALPIGPDSAHQLINAGTGPLRYLCFSTNQTAEVCGYPDSGKIGAFGGSRDGTRWVRQFTRVDAGVDYYDGEDV